MSRSCRSLAGAFCALLLLLASCSDEPHIQNAVESERSSPLVESSALPETSVSQPQSSAPEPRPSSRPEASTPEPLVPDIDLAALERHPLTPDSGEAFAIYHYRDIYDQVDGNFVKRESGVYVPYHTGAPNTLDAQFLRESSARLLPFEFPVEELFRTGDAIYVVLLPGELQELHSIYATITQNVRGADSIVFCSAQGGRIDHTLPGDGVITLPAYTPEQLTEIRREISQTLPTPSWNDLLPAAVGGGNVLEDDPVAGLLEAYLGTMMVFGNVPQTNFDTVNELSAQRFVVDFTAFRAEVEWSDERLAPLIAASGDWFGPLVEQVEQRAKILLGPDTQIQMNGYSGRYYYDRYTGILATRVFGYYEYDIPFVLEYTETDDGYAATVAVVRATDSEPFQYRDVYNQPVGEEDLLAYLREFHPKRRITFRKAENGDLHLRSHRFLDTPMQRNLVFNIITSSQTVPFKTYGGVVRYGEDAWERIRNAAYVEPEHLTLDEDGDDFYLIPAFQGSSLRVEALDWSAGEAAVSEVVYEYRMPEDGYGQFHLCVRLAPAGTTPRYRAVFAYGGDEVEYPLGLNENGELAKPPAGIAVWDDLHSTDNEPLA